MSGLASPENNYICLFVKFTGFPSYYRIAPQLFAHKTELEGTLEVFWSSPLHKQETLYTVSDKRLSGFLKTSNDGAPTVSGGTNLEELRQDNEPTPEGILVAKIGSLQDTIRNTGLNYNLVDKTVVSTVTVDSGMFELTTAWSLEDKLFKNLHMMLLLSLMASHLVAYKGNATPAPLNVSKVMFLRFAAPCHCQFWSTAS